MRKISFLLLFLLLDESLLLLYLDDFCSETTLDVISGSLSGDRAPCGFLLRPPRMIDKYFSNKFHACGGDVHVRL